MQQVSVMQAHSGYTTRAEMTMRIETSPARKPR